MDQFSFSNAAVGLPFESGYPRFSVHRNGTSITAEPPPKAQWLVLVFILNVMPVVSFHAALDCTQIPTPCSRFQRYPSVTQATDLILLWGGYGKYFSSCYANTWLQIPLEALRTWMVESRTSLHILVIIIFIKIGMSSSLDISLFVPWYWLLVTCLLTQCSIMCLTL